MTTKARIFSRWLRIIALGLAFLWAGWWTFFGLASGISEGLPPLGVLIHTTVPGLIFLAVVLIAWRWDLIGGTLLILAGLLTLWVFPFARELFGLLTLSLPPVIAGALLLMHRWQQLPGGGSGSLRHGARP